MAELFTEKLTQPKIWNPNNFGDSFPNQPPCNHTSTCPPLCLDLEFQECISDENTMIKILIFSWHRRADHVYPDIDPRPLNSPEVTSGDGLTDIFQEHKAEKCEDGTNSGQLEDKM